MAGLPLFVEENGFRAVHACWDAEAIDRLKLSTKGGVLSWDQLICAGRKASDNRLFQDIENIAKGTEAKLPSGFSFLDKNGNERHHVRLKWWQGSAQTWREIAISVPSVEELPEGPIPLNAFKGFYPTEAKPVFFGHYWLTGTPKLQARNALCLDYSAGKGGPLVTYELASIHEPLSANNISV